MNTDFHNYKIPKEGSQCIYLSVMLIDSGYRKDEDYYPQVLKTTFKKSIRALLGLRLESSIREIELSSLNPNKALISFLRIVVSGGGSIPYTHTHPPTPTHPLYFKNIRK